MKLFALASVLIAGSLVHANEVSFSCLGRTTDGTEVTVEGSYENTGNGYAPDSQLSITGTDGQGNQLMSDGSADGGTFRFFNQNQWTARTMGGWLVINAQSSQGSNVQIRHPEGVGGRDYMVIDMKETSSKPAYFHTFNLASCTF